jgi:hypothetical protein
MPLFPTYFTFMGLNLGLVIWCYGRDMWTFVRCEQKIHLHLQFVPGLNWWGLGIHGRYKLFQLYTYYGGDQTLAAAYRASWRGYNRGRLWLLCAHFGSILLGITLS